MDRLNEIRKKEKEYHEHCYSNVDIFSEGSWLNKPVNTVLEQLKLIEKTKNISVLDLGCGIGRNSIPIAQSLSNKNGKVTCVDILEMAINKLQVNASKFYVKDNIFPILSSIENYKILEKSYDYIVAVSVLEHVKNKNILEKKLFEMKNGTISGGINCIIINSSIKEIDIKRNLEIEPQFEINMKTDDMCSLLDSVYFDWQVLKKYNKHYQCEIQRNEVPITLKTNCITYVVKNIM